MRIRKIAPRLWNRGSPFFCLHEQLKKYNLRENAWLDMSDVGGGSIIGNAVERYTSYGDHWMMHCGLEVVMPTRELVRTGMGALPDPSVPAEKGMRPDQQPGNRCWQLFNYGFDLYNDGIFTESSLAIVVKMGLWLMPNSGGFQAYMITFPKDQDLHAVMDIIRPLREGIVL